MGLLSVALRLGGIVQMFQRIAGLDVFPRMVFDDQML